MNILVFFSITVIDFLVTLTSCHFDLVSAIEHENNLPVHLAITRLCFPLAALQVFTGEEYTLPLSGLTSEGWLPLSALATDLDSCDPGAVHSCFGWKQLAYSAGLLLILLLTILAALSALTITLHQQDLSSNSQLSALAFSAGWLPAHCDPLEQFLSAFAVRIFPLVFYFIFSHWPFLRGGSR